jgi:hypothetical protein
MPTLLPRRFAGMASIIHIPALRPSLYRHEVSNRIKFTRLHLGSLALRPISLPFRNSRPLITQTPLLRTIKAYGQLLERDFNPLAKSLLLRTPDPDFTCPGLLPILVVKLGAALDPGWAWPARLCTNLAVACWTLETIGPPHRHFGTQHLHGRLYPLPLLLACFRAYASSALLPAHLQGSIPDPWLAVTEAGSHPLESTASPSRNQKQT